MSDAPTFQLLIHRDGKVDTRDFDQDTVVVGRSRDCDVVLEDRMVYWRGARARRRRSTP